LNFELRLNSDLQPSVFNSCSTSYSTTLPYVNTINDISDQLKVTINCQQKVQYDRQF